ncbi:unnamed protein product, partial [Effrenium voratum]
MGSVVIFRLRISCELGMMRSWEPGPRFMADVASQATLHTRDTSNSKLTTMVWSDMGTEIAFD